jgi:hypothetical protein
VPPLPLIEDGASAINVRVVASAAHDPDEVIVLVASGVLFLVPTSIAPDHPVGRDDPTGVRLLHERTPPNNMISLDCLNLVQALLCGISAEEKPQLVWVLPYLDDEGLPEFGQHVPPTGDGDHSVDNYAEGSAMLTQLSALVRIA